MINIVKAKDSHYMRNGWITTTLIVEVNGDLEEWPYTASPEDTASHGREIFDLLHSGDLGPVLEYTEEDFKNETLLERKEERSSLIEVADYTINLLFQEKEAGVSSEDDLVLWREWVAYRKKLRTLDIEDTQTEWPIAPRMPL